MNYGLVIRRLRRLNGLKAKIMALYGYKRESVTYVFGIICNLCVRKDKTRAKVLDFAIGLHNAGEANG